MALNALLMQSMLMIDTFLVSPLGEISLAAMGIATTIIAFILGIQMALAQGSQLVLSRAAGSGSQVSLAKGFWSGAMINFSVASLFWLLLTLFESPLIALLTDHQALHAEISDYLAIGKHIVLVNAITQVMIALFNGLGRTTVPFKGYLLEMPVNAISSYFMIYGFGQWQGMGVEGAALGSLIAIGLRLAYLALCMRIDDAVHVPLSALDASMKSNSWAHFKEIFPVAANMTILSVGATIYQLIYSQLDINSYVAITLIFPWVRAGTQFITAWAMSSAISISQAIGSKNLDDLDKNIDASINVAVGLSFISCLFFLGLSFVMDDFYPDLDPATYEALAIIAPLYILLPLVRGYNTVHGHVMRSLGKTTEVFKINFTGQWLVSIPLCALAILYFELSVFWAFAFMPFEELVKLLPFRHLARKAVREFDDDKAKQLMYD
ncbi:MATE family efflux transporter [Vibrio sp. SCSIO 43136]|uniref:MATE family efflux transporter n=1 Tax=Vibrio sp. SCSIO 43136 TaxID=2819101 RepID=UPI002076258E|nr:MATE family efflux transporter [Vibrio sp. SCSIO 43136]